MTARIAVEYQETENVQDTLNQGEHSAAHVMIYSLIRISI